VSSETLRLLRELVGREGIVAGARVEGCRSAIARGSKRRSRGGATIEGAWEQIRRRASRATVGRLKKD